MAVINTVRLRILTMFITAVCFIFLLKLRWPKKQEFVRKEKDDGFQSVAYSEKKNPNASKRSGTYDLPISTSDAVPLSYRRLVVARL